MRWLVLGTALLSLGGCAEGDMGDSVQTQEADVQSAPAPAPAPEPVLVRRPVTAPALDSSSPLPRTFCSGSFRLGASLEPVRQDVETSMARWNALLGRSYFSLTAEGECPIDSASLPPPMLGNHDGTRVLLDLGRLGAQHRSSGPRLQTVVMHELGHSIGMQHVMNVPAVMAPNDLTVAEDFTTADVEECQQIRFCPVTKDAGP